MLLKILQPALTVALWVALSFIGAHRIDWTRGSIAAAVYLAGMSAIGLWVRRKSPGLIAARSKFRRKDTKGFDKIILPVILLLAFLHPLVAGWDAGCAACSSMPFATVYPGVALFILGSAAVAWVLSVNRHAETTVRIQQDRGHTVITTGPYRFLRHPMYAGSFLLFIGLPLVWQSWGAMLVSAAIVCAFVCRTALEDRMLHQELPGYAEYAKQTRFRLAPGIW